MATGNTRVVLERRSVNIHGIKHRISMKFPNSEIAQILLSEPDEIGSIDEFLAKVGTWLAVVDTEKQRVYSSLERKGGMKK